VQTLHTRLINVNDFWTSSQIFPKIPVNNLYIPFPAPRKCCCVMKRYYIGHLQHIVGGHRVVGVIDGSWRGSLAHIITFIINPLSCNAPPVHPGYFYYLSNARRFYLSMGKLCSCLIGLTIWNTRYTGWQSGNYLVTTVCCFLPLGRYLMYPGHFWLLCH
jgi:hypothetical protein